MRLHRYAITFLALATPLCASVSHAGSAPRTELVRCGADSCLKVTGYRESVAETVILNGREVQAQGDRGWRVVLPVETIRQISEPLAQGIEVTLRNPETARETSVTADLPIGLLGDSSSLSHIEVTAS